MTTVVIKGLECTNDAQGNCSPPSQSPSGDSLPPPSQFLNWMGRHMVWNTLLASLGQVPWLGMRSWKILDSSLNTTEQQLKTSVLSTFFTYWTQNTALDQLLGRQLTTSQLKLGQRARAEMSSFSSIGCRWVTGVIWYYYFHAAYHSNPQVASRLCWQVCNGEECGYT